MDPQQFPVRGHQTGCLPGCLPESRVPLTPYRFGSHCRVDPSFLSSFMSPPLPHLPSLTVPFTNGCVVLDSFPPENEESYAKGWYSDFVKESQTAEPESSQVSDVVAIRNMATGQSENYGSIGFNSHAAAERASSGSGDKRQDDSAEFSVFVANLAAEVTNHVLEQTFKVYYASVKGARVITDRTTGRSKGYGFVWFGDEDEMMRSLTELNGHSCLRRPMRIGPAGTGPASIPKATFQSIKVFQSGSAPHKTTVGDIGRSGQHPIFVDGLDSDITEENLREVCSQFGELSDVEIHEGKGCATVQFDNWNSAHKALVALNERGLGGSKVRVTWGPSTSNEQDPFGWMVQEHLDSIQQPHAAGNMLPSCRSEYNGSYEAYGYVVTNKISFQGGRPVCYQQIREQGRDKVKSQQS